MNGVLCVPAMWAFLFILIKVSSAPPPSDNVDFWPQETSVLKSSSKTSPTIFFKEMNEYWLTKEDFHESSSEEILFNICRMYYYGRFSPYGHKNYSFVPETRPKRQTIKDCCERWVLKNRCKADRSIYHPSKQSTTTKTTTLRPTTATDTTDMTFGGILECLIFSSYCPLCTINCS